MTNITMYSQLAVAVNAALQKDAQSITVFHGIENGRLRTRVTIRWAMNSAGLEFDPRAYVGSKTAFQVSVLAAEMGECLFVLDARIVSCGVEGEVDAIGVIWAVFEVPPPEPAE